MNNDIKFWNRYNQLAEVEKVYGQKGVLFLYQNFFGKLIERFILSLPIISKVYGFFQSSFLSKPKIKPFIQKFNIQMNEYALENYKSFNDFFIRKFKPNARHFIQHTGSIPAFSEGRYLGFEQLSGKEFYPVKGQYLLPRAILSSDKWAEKFEGGPLLISRLCPVDYHRFHFPDDGKIISSYRVPGALHSVNPVALKCHDNVFSVNERHVTILETENFGLIAYVEVGAIMVGKIVQTHTNDTFKRGDEKGYFLFGASTIIIIGEKGRWRPEHDILHNTQKNLETFVRLGDAVGHKI